MTSMHGDGEANVEMNTESNGSVANNIDEERSKRVYVGNLPWEVRWFDLKDLFKSTGHEVTRADIMETPDGRSKGCGIVEFATLEGAKQAVLTLNDTELNGRQIFVREDRENNKKGASSKTFQNTNNSHRFSTGEQAQSRRVYVGNLSWDVAWPDLKDHMRQAGNVVHVEVICEHNGRSKGCGIVEYATQEEAKMAMETLTHTELKGRSIFVREDREVSGEAPTSSSSRLASSHKPNTSVYVSGLSADTTWQHLKDHMRKAGNVDQATILTNHEGTSIGCGIVVYQRPHDASRAIRELQNSDLNGCEIRIREDRIQSGGRGSGRGGRGRGGRGRGRGRGHGGPGRGVGSYTPPLEGTQIFVSNLSFDTASSTVETLFSQCGQIDRATVHTFPGGRSKGYGTVRFIRKEDADAAIEKLNGVELDGRTLEVRLDQKA